MEHKPRFCISDRHLGDGDVDREDFDAASWYAQLVAFLNHIGALGGAQRIIIFTLIPV